MLPRVSFQLMIVEEPTRKSSSFANDVDEPVSYPHYEAQVYKVQPSFLGWSDTTSESRLEFAVFLTHVRRG